MSVPTDASTSDSDAQPERSRANAIVLSVWPAALAASLLNLLNFHQYPLLQPEVAIALFGVCLVGAAMGGLQLVVPRLSFILTGLYSAVLVDLNSSISLTWFYAIWAGVAAVSYLAHRIVLKLIISAAAAVLVFQVLFAGIGFADADRSDNRTHTSRTQSTTSSRPAIVHLVLDSYLGPGAMGFGSNELSALRSDQTAFYLRRGFQLYPRAYSRHTRTLNSLPYLFSYGGKPPRVDQLDAQYAVPEALPYFDDLHEQGYRTSAVLPPYFDLCARQRLSDCRHFDSSALRSMLGSELGSIDRARILGFTMLKLTTMPTRVAAALQKAAQRIIGLEGRWIYNRSKLYPLASLRALDRFNADLSSLKAGEVRFAHLLLPHDPYILDERCRVKPEQAWLDEHGPGSVDARETAYADQVRCLQQRLANTLDALDRTRAGREAIVLIHGDHGSRITPSQPYVGGPRLSQREMVMSHSALLAIRVPGEPASLHQGTHALDALMRDFRDRDFSSAPRPRNAAAEVIIMDANWQPSERRPLKGL